MRLTDDPVRAHTKLDEPLGLVWSDPPGPFVRGSRQVVGVELLNRGARDVLVKLFPQDQLPGLNVDLYMQAGRGWEKVSLPGEAVRPKWNEAIVPAGGRLTLAVPIIRIPPQGVHRMKASWHSDPEIQTEVRSLTFKPVVGLAEDRIPSGTAAPTEKPIRDIKRLVRIQPTSATRRRMKGHP